MIYEQEAKWSALSAKEAGRIMDEHCAFKDALGDRWIGGNSLLPTDTATTVRAEGNGSFVITDGPFAETKEALGGYYEIEVGTLDEALALAKQCPAPFGVVEVRPVRDLGLR